MTPPSIARVSTGALVPAATLAKLGILVVALAASLVLAAASVVLVSAGGDAMAAIGAFLFGVVAVAAVIEAVRLARQASQP